MGTARPWGSFLLKLAQFPRISCTNRISSWDKVKCQFQQYLIIYYLKALIAKVGRITWSLTCDVGACAQQVPQKLCYPWISFILSPPLPIAKVATRPMVANAGQELSHLGWLRERSAMGIDEMRCSWTISR